VVKIFAGRHFGVKSQADNLEEVSRAFQVLSDPDKKSKYDKFGGDPESRFSGASASSGASPFSGFASQRGPRGGGGSMFEEEISPEELFRQFFGGGMGGGGFGGGPFGGFGVYKDDSIKIFTHQLTRANRRQRLRLQHGRRTWSTSTPNGRRRASKTTTQPREPSLLPLLLLFIIPLLSSLFSGAAPTYPSVRFEKAAPHTEHHVSGKLKVDYYVNPKEIPDYHNWKDLGKQVENSYVQKLGTQCEWERTLKQRAYQEAQGFWSRDQVKWQAAEDMAMPACQKLKGWGYRIN
jgi:DnaJ family protein B protein 12